MSQVLKVDDKLHDRLKRVCKRQKVTMKFLTNKLLDDALKPFEAGEVKIEIVASR